jgi:hypothetical protein
MWIKIEARLFVYRFLVPSIDADSMRKQRTENFPAYLHFSDNDGNRVEPISQGLSPEMPKEVRNLERGSRRCSRRSRRSPRTFPAVAANSRLMRLVQKMIVGAPFSWIASLGQNENPWQKKPLAQSSLLRRRLNDFLILSMETLDCHVTFRDIAHRNEPKASHDWPVS